MLRSLCVYVVVALLIWLFPVPLPYIHIISYLVMYVQYMNYAILLLLGLLVLVVLVLELDFRIDFPTMPTIPT